MGREEKTLVAVELEEETWGCSRKSRAGRERVEGKTRKRTKWAL